MKSSNPNSGCHEATIAKCLDTSNPDPSKNQGGIAIVQPDSHCYCIAGNVIGRKDENGTQYGSGINEDIAFTLNTTDKQFLGNQEAFSGDYHIIKNYIVRRLTPKECKKLMSLPDNWTDNLAIPNPTQADLDFWLEVFITKRQIDGMKPPTLNQVKKFLKKPYSDSACYKMCGNGVVVNCAEYVLSGIAETLKESEMN